MVRALLSEYREMKERIPHVSLGTFPTPVERLSGLEDFLGTSPLFVKRDDRSSDVYGGNKVRKLEFVLADALARKKRHAITFGYAGSNHSLAVAVFAGGLGLQPIALHIPQPNAEYVRRNLLLQDSLGAQLHHYGNLPSIYAGTLLVAMQCFLKSGRFPCIIPPGGSNVLGTIGMVGAVFELQEQVEEGLLPEPDVLYVPLGSCGTAAGIALGVKALRWKTRIRAVRISERKEAGFHTVRKLFRGAARKLKRLMPSFPSVELAEPDFEVCEDYLGDGYAHFTQKGMEAVRCVAESDGIKLEGTYSGKTMAALIDDAREGKLAGKTTLFWNTYNSVDFGDRIEGRDFRRLPKAYHGYFTEDDQPLEIHSGKERRWKSG